MASRYWVGGTNTWDGTAGTKWAASSGGAGGSSVPTAADDVFFDASSGVGNVTYSSATVARSINCTGFAGTITHPASTTINIGDGTAGAGNIALKYVAGMTLTLGSPSSSIINFISTSTTQQSIITGGKTMPAMTLNGVGGSWIWGDAITLTQTASAVVTLTNGSLDFNSQNFTAGGFLSNVTNIRTLLLRASVINVSCNGNGGWQVNSTNLTFDAGTSAITVNTSNTATVFGSGLTYYDFTNIYGNGSGVMTGPNVVISRNAVFQGGNQARLMTSTDFDVRGNLSIIGNSNVSVPIMMSNTNGVTRTITVQPTSTVTITNCIFQDIAISGANAPYATTYTGDAGGNSGMSLSAPRTLYAVNNGATGYQSTSTWSLSSGGASGQNPPMPQDTAIWDALSITSSGKTITLSSQGMPTIDFSNVLNNPTVNFSNTNGRIYFMGNFIMKAGMAISGTTSYYFRGKNDQYIDTKGITSTAALGGFDLLPGKKLMLLSDYVASVTCTLDTSSSGATIGEFSTNGFNFTALTAITAATTVTKTITFTNTVTVTGTGTVFDMRGANVTLNMAGSNLVISDTSATGKSISRTNGQSLNDVTIPSGSGVVSFINATTSTINNLNVTGPAFVRFNSGGASYTWLGNWNFTSGPAAIVTIDTNIAGNAATMVKTSGVLAADYMSLKDNIASGGAAFYAGRNSTFVSGVSGWTATAYFIKSLTESVTISEVFTKQFGRLLTDIISITEVIIKKHIKTITDTVTITELFTHVALKTFVDSITLTESFKRLPIKNLLDTISITELFTRLTRRTFTDAVTLADYFLKGKVPILKSYTLKALTPISVILKDVKQKIIKLKI